MNRSECFPKSRRLLKRNEFRLALRQGRRMKSGELSIALRKNQLGFSRLGVSIGRAVGSAVKRNRIRRQIREVFRRSTELGSQSIDVVFHLRGKHCEIDHETIRECFEVFFQKGDRSVS